MNKIEATHDELVKYVMDIAREFAGDPDELPSARVVDGVEMYQVGCNASHEFYLGVKDGELYRYAVGEDFDPPPQLEKCVNWPGYIGHL